MTGATPRLLVAIFTLGVTLLWAVILAQLHLAARATPLDRLEASFLDLRFLAFGSRPAPTGTLIAAIDDDTIRWARSFPIPRRLLGEAVSRLFGAGARAVVIDALFLDPGTPDDDAALAAALAGGPAAVATMLQWPPGSEDRAGAVPSCEQPIAAVARVAALGTVNIALDRSGIARHIPMLLPCGDAALPALPLRAAFMAAGRDPVFGPDGVKVGDTETPLDAGRNLALRYYGPEGTIPTVSLGAVARDEAATSLARDRIVLIGATAHGTGDRFPTPFDSIMPGVEVLATATANLQSGDALVRTSKVRLVDAIFAAVLALAAVAGLLIEKVGRGLLAGAALLALWFAAVLVGFAHGVWFSMAVPLAALLPAAALAGAGRLGLDRHTERSLRLQHGVLAGFQSPSLLARLARDPAFLSEPIEREIVTVFVDISGFTGLSERVGARAVRDLLKRWHDLVEDGVSTGGGVAASYMADGAMLVWGMTEARPDDALRAVRTALLLERATRRLFVEVEGELGPLDLKIGGHIGQAVLSRLGGAGHEHITAIGDSVNVASRLMKIAPERDATIALSAALAEAALRQGLLPSEAEVGPAKEVAIRGRLHPIAVCLVKALSTDR